MFVLVVDFFVFALAGCLGMVGFCLMVACELLCCWCGWFGICWWFCVCWF